MDELELEVRDLTCYSYLHGLEDLLMSYWHKYRKQMTKIFKQHYDEESLPKWVNYELFKFDIEKQMALQLFEEIINNDFQNSKDGDEMDVDFSFVLGIVLCTDHLDTGCSDIWSGLNRLKILMPIKHIVQN